MSSFHPNDKVVCIDDSRFPLNNPGGRYTLDDFELPSGFVEEGAVYCVEDCEVDAKGSAGLFIVGKPVLVRGSECAWHASRFRKVERTTDESKEQEKRERMAGLHLALVSLMPLDLDESDSSST